ncbi:MAG: glycosyltransferase, partial [Lachnospiraceae bacterium]|nr:glycosyltransferase [Lachnospiraceae bacterium]
MKRIAIMCIWDFRKYDDKNGGIRASTPLTFGYADLKNEYDIEVITHNKNSLFYKVLKLFFKDEARSIMIQLMCCHLHKQGFDLIYYPVDRHALLLGILRKMKFVKLPILMMNHFSYNTNYVRMAKGLFLRIERNVLFYSIDQIVFPGKKILEIALEDYNVPHKHRVQVCWGADLDYFDNCLSKEIDGLRAEDYYMAAGSANRDYETLIQAFGQLSSKLKIFGNGSYEFEKYKSNCEDNIEIYNLREEGIAGELKIRDYYCNSKAVLIPILEKNDVPNGATVLIEALAAGKPV